ncbi:MAG: hypothetical protein IJJ61_07545 [Clostridia bacterium]|nr:hypothetical protein [Clostridia bacterium]
MKKSLRILSLVLAVVMLLGSLSVAASAYQSNYKGDPATVKNSVVYDDVDQPVFTLEQYAEMALDALDRLLDENKMVLDIYVGTLEISDVDHTIGSVRTLYSNVGTLLESNLLGDASLLGNAMPYISNTKRSNGDMTVIYDLLDFISALAPIVKKYVNGTVSLGILDSFIKNYVFDVRELAFGMLIQLTGLADDIEGFGEDWEYFEDRRIPAKYLNNDGTTVDAMILAQDILNKYVLGEFKQLDSLFYSAQNTTSHIAFQEIQFRSYTASGGVGNIVTGDLNTNAYDYYGWVHDDNWVTVGLGDFVRVSQGAAKPDASKCYSRINLSNLKEVYPFVEDLFLQAYNGILVPVLNRITKRWVREKMGYTFDKAKTEEFQLNEDGSVKTDANGEPLINPTYDYLYLGDAPEEVSGDKIFRIFDPETMSVPYYDMTGYTSFVLALNHNLGLFIDSIIKYSSKSTSGAATTYTWKLNPEDEGYSFTWTDGDNSYLVNNLCSALKFLMCVTEDDFFDEGAIERGEVKTPAEVNAMGNQALLAYVLRSVMNANVSYIYIPEGNTTNDLAGVALQACIQLAYQDIPQFTYTAPVRSDFNSDQAYYEAVVNKALAILMDVAAYNLNSVLDTNLNATATDANYNVTNNGTTNRTGLLGYLGDSGSYTTTAVTIAAWAVYTWASTEINNVAQCLLALDFKSDDYKGKTTNLTANDVWGDLDLLVNSLIPIDADNTGTSGPDNRPWISNEIASYAGSVVYNILFNYIVYPVLGLNILPIQTLLTKNDSGAFAYDNIQTVLVDTVHRIFDVLFPDVFDHEVVSIDTFLNNGLLAGMASDLIRTLGANNTFTGEANGHTLTGRGKIIAGVALPIVCMVLHLSDKQEFKELENHLPSVAAATSEGIDFSIYNGSSGVNTSFRDKNDNYKRKIDRLYSYTITGATCTIIDGTGMGNTLDITGVTPNSTVIMAGDSVPCNISGLSNNQMLEVTFSYKVSDENGNFLNNGTALTSTSYCYVSASDKGDDEALHSTIINGATIQYPTDIYLSSGDSLSKLEGYSFRIEDTKTNQGVQNPNPNTFTAVNVTAAGISAGANRAWVSKNSEEEATSQSLTHQGGTYAFMPFSVDTESFKRTEFEYQKEDGSEAYVEDDWGMRIKTAIKEAPDGVTWIPDGEYTATTTISVGGVSGTITTRIHIYDDFGLPSLVRNAVNANRSLAGLKSGGSSYWTPYYNALKSAAAFVYQPNIYGGDTQNGGFAGHINASNVGTINESNTYLTLYRTLYTQIETIKQWEKSEGALALWNAVNNVLPYNYTRASYDAEGSEGDYTVYYQDYKEYYESGYGFVGMRNYVGHTYRNMKDAVSYANGLIDREYKWVWTSEEDYNNMTVAQKEEYATTVDNYKTDVTENTTAIKAVESAYALHRLSLTAGRLIPIDANKSKLNWALTPKAEGGPGFADRTEQEKSWSTGSWAAYSHALTFANAVAGNENATAEMVNCALTKLIEAWKNLAEGANYTQLSGIVTSAKDFINNNVEGYGLNTTTGAVVEEEASEQSVYTPESYIAFLGAIKAGDILLSNYTNGKGLAKSDQDVIDKAAAAITAAQEALVPFGSSSATFELDTSSVYEGSGAEYTAIVMDDDAIFVDGYGLETVTITENGNDVVYTVDGVLYGVPENATGETLEEMFTVEGCYVDVVPVNAAREEYGTGSYIIIRDESTDAPLAFYIVAYRGDVNGDCSIDGKDINNLKRTNAQVDGYQYCNSEASFAERKFAGGADVNGDGGFGLNDLTIAKYVFNQVRYISQTTGKYV